MRQHASRLRLFLAASGVVLSLMTGSGQVREYIPVTDAILQNPSPNDWLHFRRTYDHQGYSPLEQINKQNVHQLQLAWAWQTHPGMSEATPHVYNGMMFINNPSGGVQALDAATGELIWDFETPMVPVAGARVASSVSSPRGNAYGPSRPIRNLALYGDKVYTGTDDTHGSLLTALDARTGKVMWQTKVGYGFSGGPVAIKGKILAGTQNCEEYKIDDPPCYIGAYDSETGEELWKTSTIARPGEPGGDTWGDLPLEFRAGGDNWQAGSYDPKLNLTYWGTAQAKPWSPYQRGTDGTTLYTSSTLALDVDTGKITWYYQHIPGEAFDQDETFERILVDYDGKQSSFSMGKIGILWELDRRTGAFRAAHDLGYQDQGTIDPKTGQLRYDPARLPKPGVPISFCPNIGGVKTWRAMSYHPQTQAFYIPLSLVCATGTPPPPCTERKIGQRCPSGFGRQTYSFHPKSPEGLGEFVAMDMKSGKILWRHRRKTPSTMSALTTAGGLVVSADEDRYLYVHDVQTGKILYQTRLPGVADGSPSTYTVNGRQYLAIPVGTGSGGTWLVSPRTLLPDVKLPPWEEWPTAVYVFALPQQR